MISSRTTQVLWGIVLVIQGVIMLFGKFTFTGQFLAIESIVLLIMAGFVLRRHIVMSIIFIAIGSITSLSKYFTSVTHIYTWISIICLTGGIIFILLPTTRK